VTRVSVVILNRDRVKPLNLVLTALSQQSHREFELVVVTNRPEDVSAHPLAARIKIVAFEAQNISAARNVGVAAAFGDIVAFCDDDAVPEPTWVAQIIAPFSDSKVGAVGGLVRGRNGVSLQWGQVVTDRWGNDSPISGAPTTSVFPADPLCVPKTIGTCCAFRRSALAEVGGFDESFHYFLDETDANRRLVNAGWSIALTTKAEVHHSYASNAHRNTARTPLSLFEIAASKAHFVRQHGDNYDGALARFRQDQEVRLLSMVEAGRIYPSKAQALLQELEAGFEAGRKRTPILQSITSPSGTISPYCEGPAPDHLSITSSIVTRRRRWHRAIEARKRGLIVTVMEVLPSFRMTTVCHLLPGIWRHRGGAWGRTDRAERLITPRTRSSWIEQESQRIKQVRGIQ